MTARRPSQSIMPEKCDLDGLIEKDLSVEKCHKCYSKEPEKCAFWFSSSWSSAVVLFLVSRPADQVSFARFINSVSSWPNFCAFCLFLVVPSSAQVVNTSTTACDTLPCIHVPGQNVTVQFDVIPGKCSFILICLQKMSMLQSSVTCTQMR